MDIKFTQGSIEKDFFEQNPHWKYLDSSQKLLKKFSKEIASKLRWAVFLILDPDSLYHRYAMIKRVELANKYLGTSVTLKYDVDSQKIINKALSFLFDSYSAETMSKAKKDYFDRDLSYQLLVQQERESTDLKLKADVQVKLDKIYTGLEKSLERYESENKEQRTKNRGKEQRGKLFK